MPEVSIVIPVFNEAQRIAEAVRRSRGLGSRESCEIIVVDGGSSDETVLLARDADRVIIAPKGRGVQLNAGVEASSGELLLFLHADCWLEPAGFKQLIETLQDPGIAWGGFQQIIEHSDERYRIVERGNAWRAQWLGWVYGDQGMFVRRAAFDAVGGFPEFPLMEDLYFSKKLKNTGRRAILGRHLHVDARRWMQQGIVRQTLRNWWFIARAHSGASLDRLAREYRDIR